MDGSWNKLQTESRKKKERKFCHTHVLFPHTHMQTYVVCFLLRFIPFFRAALVSFSLSECLSDVARENDGVYRSSKSGKKPYLERWSWFVWYEVRFFAFVLHNP